MKTIEKRAKAVLAQHTNQPTAIDLYSKNEVLEMLVEIATEQEAIDDAELHQRFEKVLNGQKWYLIETIPQLYIRWLLIDDEHGFEKPTWEEYANKVMEEQIWE